MDIASVPLTEDVLKEADVTLLLTDHSAFDYCFIEKHARRIVDTRNAFGARKIVSSKITKA